MQYYGLKMDAVQFATDLQKHSENAWQSTTITRVARSEVYCVSIAIDGLSVATVETLALTYSLRPTNTWLLNTPAIKSLKK